MRYGDRVRRLFGARPKAIASVVGPDRVFSTDSESLDDGPSEVPDLFASLARIVGADLRIERPHATSSAEVWSVSFFDGAKTWRGDVEPRSFEPMFDLVNRALHAKGATRRVHLVESAAGGQGFSVVCATIEQVQRLLDVGWDVGPGRPTVPHVLICDGLRFGGHEPYRVQDGRVFDAVLSEPQTILGIACAAGPVSFARGEDDDGTGKPELVSAVLARDLPTRYGAIRAGSTLSFWNVARRIPNEVALLEPHDLGGWPCAAGTDVSFAEDGTLAAVRLARAYAVPRDAGPFGGRELAAGSLVWLDRDGLVESVDEPSSDDRA